VKKTDDLERLGLDGRMILSRIRWLGLHSSDLSQGHVNEIVFAYSEGEDLVS